MVYNEGEISYHCIIVTYEMHTANYTSRSEFQLPNSRRPNVDFDVIIGVLGRAILQYLLKVSQPTAI